MKLWIRSQDKKELIQTNSIFISQNNLTICARYNSGWIAIGNYKTKERALEVLDEIQSFVDRNKDYPANTYEMPKE